MENTTPQGDDSKDKKESLEEKIKRSIAENKHDESIKEDVIEDLTNNAKYADFFAQYNDYSVSRFIEQYAYQKSMSVRFNSFHINQEDKAVNLHRTQAEWALKAIQRKKLFDVELQWRANLFELPNITYTVDFEYWRKNALNCPYIDPITAAEVDIYKQFLLQYTYQNKVDDNGEENFFATEDIVGWMREGSGPAWYMYHNLMTGAGKYLLLKDERNEEEMYYRELNWDRMEEEKKKEAAEQGEKPIEVRLPSLDSDKDSINAFAKQFESVLGYERIVRSTKPKFSKDLNFELGDLLIYMQEIEKHVPIKAHYDWRIALAEAYHDHTQKHIAAALDAVFEDYQFKMETGIGYPLIEETMGQPVSEIVIAQIEKGKAIDREQKENK